MTCIALILVNCSEARYWDPSLGVTELLKQMGLQVILEACQSVCIPDTIRQIVPEFRSCKREGSVFKPVLVL